MWQPDPESLQRLIGLIQKGISSIDNQTQKEVAEEFDIISRNPQLGCYLLWIILDYNIALQIRQTTAFSLVSAIDKGEGKMEQQDQLYIKQAALQGLQDQQIGEYVSKVIGPLYARIKNWPELFVFIQQNVQNQIVLKSLCDVLKEMNNDYQLAQQLEEEAIQQTMIQLYRDLQVLVQQGNTWAIECFDQLALIMPQSLIPFIQPYLQTILTLAQQPNESNIDVLIQALLTLSTIRKDLVKPAFSQLAMFFITYICPPFIKKSVSFFLEWVSYKELLQPLLEQLLPKLHQNLKLTDEDLMNIMPDDNFRYSKSDETPENYTQRSECACLLDTLAQKYGDVCYGILQPYIEASITNANPLEFEAGLLSLGTISIGCTASIRPYLQNLFKFSIDQFQSQYSYIKSTAIWTSSRLSQDASDEALLQYFLQGLIEAIKDTNQQVQIAACTAFSNFMVYKVDYVKPFIMPILQIFTQLLPQYTGRPLLNLLDSLASLADSAQTDLQQPQFVQLLAEPVIQLYNNTRDNDRLIWTLSETLSSIVLALQGLFEPYALPLLQRCIQIISQNQEESQFTIKSLELAGFLIEVTANLPNLSQLSQLVLQCLQNKDVGVRQYAAATFADILVYKNSDIIDCIPQAITLLLNNVETFPAPPDISELFSAAANNSICAIGEIAVQNPLQIAPYAQQVLEVIVREAAKCKGQTLLRSNLFIAYGKIGNASPELVSQTLGLQFFNWVKAMEQTYSSPDKEFSYIGMFQSILVNLQVLIPLFQYFSQSVLQYEDMPENVINCANQILTQFKSQLTSQQWEMVANSVENSPMLLQKCRVFN